MRSQKGQATGSGPAGVLMIGALRLYQWTLSPVVYALGVRCRHEPSCSHYGVDSIRAQGGWRGFFLTAGRLLRCRPGGTHGYDPAPRERKDVPFWAITRFRDPPRRQITPPAGQRDDEIQK
ncbi:MAG: membrane protein insertion efficiency factor YidD [Maricaulis sp.]|jgi:putative membrane protein insertion efficiency factor|nr:membrane protein insertion efficiency factor YidD [Maricaulis sp.]HAQ36387.1 membrane protein insertion efficiency factor YidD [Alphaproteobacteria bacterium]|tara:strand:- start:188 stop:550 length:363 start_codon:yes stop_codon:yes gene_type:complete